MGGSVPSLPTGGNLKLPTKYTPLEGSIVDQTDILPNIPLYDIRSSNPVDFAKRATDPFAQVKADMRSPAYKLTMGNKNVVAAKDKSKSVLQQTGQVLADFGTLGQSYSARQAKKSQAEMLAEMRAQQAAEQEALRKLGPAPRMISPTDKESMTGKRKRIDALRRGLASTIKTGKTRLGE